MSASIAWTIWNSPIRWPNCFRSRAYCAADVERALGDPDRLRGDPRPRAIERPHRELPALALVADPVRLRDEDVVEVELGGRAAADAHLVLESGDLEARRSGPRRRSAMIRLCRGASGSVTAKTVISPATLPLVMNRFVPEIR